MSRSDRGAGCVSNPAETGGGEAKKLAAAKQMVSPSVCTSRSQLPPRGSQKELEEYLWFSIRHNFCCFCRWRRWGILRCPKGPAALAAAGLLFLLFLLEPGPCPGAGFCYRRKAISAAACWRASPAKGVLAAGILLALAPLIGFKYLGFLTKSVLSVLAHLGVQIAPPAFDFLLLMGISFIRCRLWATWWIPTGAKKAEHNLLDFALFVGFFPRWSPAPIKPGAAGFTPARRPSAPA